MASSDCDKEDATEIGVIAAVFTALEISRFEPSGSTSGLTPPYTDVDILYFSDISPPSFCAYCNKPP